MPVTDKLTKGLVSSIIGACAIVFAIFLFVDDRYFQISAAEQMKIDRKTADDHIELKLAGALNEQMMRQQNFYMDQQKINDMRQLDQLRCSKALLESELRRNPNDSLLREKLGIINTQIKALEKSLYGIE